MNHTTIVIASFCFGAALCAPSHAREEKPLVIKLAAADSDKPGSGNAASVVFVQAAAVGGPGAPEGSLQQLIGEALLHNPEIAAAMHERDAAGNRISPAGALDDPMFEAGVLNLPLNSLRFNREDMTMKMLGISQKLPYPGKLGLRQDVAAKNSESVAFGYRETLGRVVREVRIAYYDLALIDRTIALMEQSRQLIEQLLRIAEGRYSVGQSAQAEVLKAQTQLAKMSEELVRARRERRTMEADLQRALGRGADAGAIQPEMPRHDGSPLRMDELREAALRGRPQLLGLQALIDKSDKSLELARKEYYPDFDVRLAYGQRDKTLDGMTRPDMFSLTVAINLPVWRKEKLDPLVAEAQAMREQAISLYQGQYNELLARLRQQVAIAEQSRESARLYETGILPQARLSLESALSAYRVNRVDFSMLLDSQMTVLSYEINHASALVAMNKALAEIDQLTGKSAAEAASKSPQGEKQ